MNKSLALRFWMLLSFTEVGGLTCVKCYREYMNGTCRMKTQHCQAGSGESCFRQKLIVERAFLYTRTGCAPACKNVDGGVYIRHTNKCCTQNFCNQS